MLDDRPTCLICGERFRSVGRHVAAVHGISAQAYRDQYGIRRGASLSSPQTRARQGDMLRATIAAGKLDSHFATNAERAIVAAAAGAAEKRAMRESGIDLPHGTPATPRAVLAAVVADIEAGAKLSTAVRRSSIGYSAFHAGLVRHPDLRDRVEAAKALRRKGGPRLV